MCEVPVEIEDDLLSRLPRHNRVELHDVVSDPHNLRGLDSNVLCLPLRSSHWLVDHDSRVRKREPSSSRARAKKKGGHRGGQTHVHSDHLGADVLDGVVDGQSGDDRSSRAIDVQVDGLVRVLVVQILIIKEE